MKYLLHTVKKWGSLYSLVLLTIIGFTACNSSKQVAYFQDISDSANVEKRVRNAAYEEPIIRKGDILHIEVTTIDAKIGGVSNEKQTENGSADEGGMISGYLVDKNGYVEVPIIGKLQVEGLTTIAIKELVRASALKYYKDPLVNIRIANFYVTVLGEVKKPGRYVLNGEKVNIIDAIGLAGDLTLGGKRGNIIVIREENGETVFTRVDMNSTDIFHSKYFYLQSGDKLYVEPLKVLARSGTNDQRIDRVVSLTLGLVSVTLALVGLVAK